MILLALLDVVLGHLWVQAWTDNLNLRVLLRAFFDIISSSGRSPVDLFLRSENSPASVCPSNCPSVNISCYRISSKTTGRIFKNLVRLFPSVSSCASTKKNSGPSTNMATVGHLCFFLLSHLLRNYLTDSNETCLLCSSSCASTEKIPLRRQIRPFVSRLGLSEISR